MATTAQQVITASSELIQDSGQARVTDDQWYGWITDAMRIICSLRPDACSSTENIILTTLTSKQSINGVTGARRLIGLTRNMGANGLVVGKAIRGPVPREVMDSFNPDWPTVTGSYVKEYMYNPQRPKEFFIFPHLTSTWYVEAELAKNPTVITDTTDSLDTDDIYTPSVITWCVYRALSRDSEESPNFIRAAGFMNEFLHTFGLKQKSDIKIDPHLVEFGKTISM